MGIQFIQNQRPGPAELGAAFSQSMDSLLTTVRENKLAKLQEQHLQLAIAGDKIRNESLSLENQLVGAKVADETSVREAVKKTAPAYVDAMFGGDAPGEYKALATTVTGRSMLEHFLQVKDDTEMRRENIALLRQQRSNAEAQAPYIVPTAIAQQRSAQAQAGFQENQLGVALQTRDTTVGLHKASLGEALDKLPKPVRDELMKSMPDLGAGVKSGALDYSSINDMVEQLAQTDPSAAMTLKMAGTFGGHYLMQPSAFDEKGNPQPSPFANATSKLNDMWVKRQEALDRVKGGKTTTKSEESDKTIKGQAVAQSTAQLRQDQQVTDQHEKFFDAFDQAMKPVAGGGGMGAGFYHNPAMGRDWSQPPAHFQGKGHGEYSKKDLENIFSITQTPDATNLTQVAKVNFLLDKIVQSDNPRAVYQGFLNNGGKLTQQQIDAIQKLSKVYGWQIEGKK